MKSFITEGPAKESTQSQLSLGSYGPTVLSFTYEPPHEKTCLRHFQPDPTQTRFEQPQKTARGLNFRIKKEEGLYYLCSEIKGADLLCAYFAADLCLVFVFAKNRFSQDTAHIREWFFHMKFIK